MKIWTRVGRAASWPFRKVAGAAANATKEVAVGILKNWLIKSLYGVAALVAAWLMTAAQIVPPPGSDDITKWIWSAMVAALVGLAAVIKRWAQSQLNK